MAVRYGFFNSINHDRKYDALDISSIFDGIIEDGVFETIGNIFAITPGIGMQIVVDSGKAWFDHTWTTNDAPLPLDIGQSDITLGRYDAVVIEVNNTQSVRANSIKIIQGEASSSPQHPVLPNTDDIHTHPLAYIFIPGGSDAVEKNNIHFVVGTAECPFVTGPLETVPIDALFERWEAEFDNWFSNLKINLSGDVAANLQRQIDENYAKTLSDETRVILGLPNSATPDDAIKLLNTKIKYIGLESGFMTLTILDHSGSPISGMFISGMLNDAGEMAQTNENGIAMGPVAAGDSILLSPDRYIDIEDFSKSYSIIAGESYSDTWTLTHRNYVEIRSTTQGRFSKLTSTLDLTVVGGGGSGALPSTSNSGIDRKGGGAGAGGYCTVEYDVKFEANSLYTFTVGAGGTKPATVGSNGKAGGESSALGVSAKGGSGGSTPAGGSGNGNGGTGSVYNRAAATAGSDGSVLGFSGFTQTKKYGGGGGGGTEKAVALAGGLSGGGSGACRKSFENYTAAKNGVDGGGGGGGFCEVAGSAGRRSAEAGSGGNGLISARMHPNS